MVDMPIAISYDTICALERSPPSSAYLLFDAHPASTMPNTPSEASARMYRNPIGRSARTMSIRPQGSGSGAANGMTAHTLSAGIKASAGAIRNSGLLTAAGSVSSFMKFLTPSASGCPHPLSTRLGPSRS